MSFYNLEVNPDRGCPRPKIAQAIEGGLNLIDYSGALVSFDDTAALIANLDIVLGSLDSAGVLRHLLLRLVSLADRRGHIVGKGEQLWRPKGGSRE